VLRFHAPAGEPPLEQARRARAGLEQLVAALPDPDTDYGRFLRAETEALRDDSDVYLFHEFLAADNRPLLVEEFARMAAGHGLQFLAEARFGTNSFVQRGEVRRAVDAVSDDLVRREQHLDFLRNRHFRQSLVCHAEVRPSWAAVADAVNRLRIVCRVEPLDEEGRFRLDGGKVVGTDDPLLREMVSALRAAWPRPVTVSELAERVAEGVGPDERADGLPPELTVGPLVIRGYAEGLWQLYAFDPPFTPAVSDRPLACPLARRVAETSAEVTNRLHRPVALAEAERAVLRRLDGQTGCDRLAADLGVSREAVEESLRRLAEGAVLVG
jgi:methyltransferase-like protein